MNVFHNIYGIMAQTFRLSGPSGPRLKAAVSRGTTSPIELRNNADTAYVTGRALRIQQAGSDLADLTTLFDNEARVVDVQFSFAGASAPAAGANSAKFGFCHTSGGAYSAGDVVYDNAASIIVVPQHVAMHLTTRDAISGTISMSANWLYARVGFGNSWQKKCDASGAEGAMFVIEIPFAHDNANPSSTTALTDGMRIHRQVVEVTEAFSGAGGAVGFSASMEADDSITFDGRLSEGYNEADVNFAFQYEKSEIINITSANAGVIEILVAGAGLAAGEGRYLCYASDVQA